MERSRKLIAVVATAGVLVGGTVAHAATGSDGSGTTLPAVTPLTPTADDPAATPAAGPTTPSTDDSVAPSPDRGDRGGRGGGDCPQDEGGSGTAPSETPSDAPATPETSPAPTPTTPTPAPTTTPEV